MNPIIKNPSTNPTLLTGISLVVGNNVINHTLGTMQQGWILMDIDAASVVYRSAPFNTKTLTLHSSANCQVTLGVF